MRHGHAREGGREQDAFEPDVNDPRALRPHARSCGTGVGSRDAERFGDHRQRQNTAHDASCSTVVGCDGIEAARPEGTYATATRTMAIASRTSIASLGTRALIAKPP